MDRATVATVTAPTTVQPAYATNVLKRTNKIKDQYMKLRINTLAASQKTLWSPRIVFLLDMDERKELGGVEGRNNSSNIS